MKALLGNHENRVPGNMKNAFREPWSVSGTMKARVGNHENRVPGNMKNAFREPWSASTVHVRVYCRGKQGSRTLHPNLYKYISNPYALIYYTVGKIG